MTARTKIRVWRLKGHPASQWYVRVHLRMPTPTASRRVSEGFLKTEAQAREFLTALGAEEDPFVIRIELIELALFDANRKREALRMTSAVAFGLH